MTDKTKTFRSATNNLEIKVAIQQVRLLKQYMAAKTEAQKNKLAEKFVFEIPIMLKKFPPEILIERLEKAIALDKYRPRNLSVYTFANLRDLDYIDGEFSTFDSDLRDMLKNGEDTIKIKEYATKLSYNRRNVAKQYAADIIKILNQNPKLKNAAIASGATGDKEPWHALLQRITDRLRTMMGIETNATVRVVDSWDELPTYFPRPQAGDITYGQFVEYYKNQDASKMYYEIQINRGLLSKLSRGDLFPHVIATFAHEFGHVVDHDAPNKGALGEQKAKVSEKLYKPIDVNQEHLYYINPTEASSYEIQATIMRALQNGKI